ncbi:hypothetical protein D3C78_1841400 [compost metagenome]
MLTKLMTISGPVYTDLLPHEVRSYMQGGVKANTISGFEKEDGTVPIIIAIDAIEWIYV